MATITTEVELDEFSTDEILSELEWRVSRLNKDQKAKYKKTVLDYVDEEDFIDIRINTVVDRMKYDFFVENFDKITLEQLELLV